VPGQGLHAFPDPAPLESSQKYAYNTNKNDFKYVCCIFVVLEILLLSYEKVKRIVEVDEKIMAVFTLNSDGKTTDIFIASDAKIDRAFIETVRLNLDLKFKTIEKSTTSEEDEEEKAIRTNPIGKHLWDISEYDKIRVIRIYEANRLIVVLAKPHTSPGDTADAVLGYLYESNEEREGEEQEQEEQVSPPCLF
jgi:hypothetical protein